MIKLSANAQAIVKKIHTLDVWKERGCDTDILYAGLVGGEIPTRLEFEAATQELISSGVAINTGNYVQLV